MSNVRTYYVYILVSKAGVLYTGVTNNLKGRVLQHKTKLNAGFTQQYDVDSLVYFERFSRPRDAIAREKQIKAYRREKRAALIDSINPDWVDFSDGWYDKVGSGTRQAAIAAADLRISHCVRDDPAYYAG
jgi:putative endonuclease